VTEKLSAGNRGQQIPEQDGAWQRTQTQIEKCRPGENTLEIYKRIVFLYTCGLDKLNMKLVLFSLRKAHEIRKRIKSMRECASLLDGSQKHEDKQVAVPIPNFYNLRKPPHSSQPSRNDALEKPAKFLSGVNRGKSLRR
jgi:hypothetical protein